MSARPHPEVLSSLEELVAVLAPMVAEQLQPADELLDVDQAAALMHASPRWMRDQARANRIPHRRHGKAYIFSRRDLMAWSEARSQGPRHRVEGSTPSLRSVRPR